MSRSLAMIIAMSISCHVGTLSMSMSMSMSISSCRAQSDSMQKNCRLVALGKDGKGEGGIAIWGGRRGGGDEERRMKGTKG